MVCNESLEIRFVKTFDPEKQYRIYLEGLSGLILI